MDKKKTIILVALAIAVAAIVALSVAIPLSLKTNKDYSNQALRILEKYPLIDGHNDLSYMIRENFQNQFDRFELDDMTKYNLAGTGNVTHTDLKRLAKGKLGGQFWAVYADCQTQGKDALRVHMEQLENMQRLFARYPKVFKYATNASQIRQAFKENKVASLFGLESGHAIDSSLAILRQFFDLGVRYMTLTHNCNTPWADNNLVDVNTTAARHDGLTEFGKVVIKEMNRLGMMVDISHVSHKTMLDALEVSKSPVMFSHSSVYSLCGHQRNVQDDVLRKLKENNGVIMINFFNNFVTCKNEATLKDVVDHFEYVKKLIGVDYIGVGADYDGVGRTPVGLEDVSTYPALFAELLSKGWREEELGKIAGGNILRVMEANEKYAESVKNEPAFDEIIGQEFVEEYSNCRVSF